MTKAQRLFAIAALAVLSACSNKDREVTTGKSTTLDEFQFKPRTPAEMTASAVAAASAPRLASAHPSALDDFHFKPRTTAEMSRQQPKPPGTPPTVLDTFVFVPRTTNSVASGAR